VGFGPYVLLFNLDIYDDHLLTNVAGWCQAIDQYRQGDDEVRCATSIDAETIEHMFCEA
jgi:hypothetical protein